MIYISDASYITYCNVITYGTELLKTLHKIGFGYLDNTFLIEKFL